MQRATRRVGESFAFKVTRSGQQRKRRVLWPRRVHATKSSMDAIREPTVWCSVRAQDPRTIVEAHTIQKTTRSLCGEPTAALVLLRNSVTTTCPHVVEWQTCLRPHDEARS